MPAIAQQQAPLKPLGKMSLEELLSQNIVAPSKVARPLRESPAVATVITREEIVRSGARDVLDVLMMIPGFFFGTDVFGTVGLGFRGNWGLEGKILVLLDGHELNETLFLTTIFGAHYPAERIERVEVVRGPGSVIYGGYAELAVVSITTREAAGSIEGVSVSVEHGQMDGTRGRSDLNVAVGHTFDNGLRINVGTRLGDGIRSTADYRDVFGNSFSLKGYHIDPKLVTAQAEWGGLTTRFLLDDYHLTQRDGFDVALDGYDPNDFLQRHASAEYRWRVGNELVLTPRVSYKHQRQFSSGLPESYYHKTGEKYQASVIADWSIRPNQTLLTGVEWFLNRAHLNNPEFVGIGGQFPFAEGNEDDFHTVAGFSELLLRHRFVNLSLGLRLEDNERFGTEILPRVGLTTVFHRFHAKLLFSKAFKAPGHENFGLNLALDPERTTAYEVEAGYQFTDHMFVGVNLFDVTIRDPIIFFFDVDIGSGNYVNENRTGSRGLEAEYRLKHARWHADLRYSFYDVIDNDSVALYAVPGRENVHRGFPAHKLTLDGGVELSPRLTFNSAVLYLGPRYGTLDLTPDGTAGLGEEGPTWLVNLHLLYAHKGWSVRAGVHNLFDESLRFLQPYDSGHAPLAAQTREWSLRLAYAHRFGAGAGGQ